MAENDQDRPLPASPRRLEQAREEGRVARSRELGTAFVLLGAAAAFAVAGSDLAAATARLFARALQFDRAAAFSSAALGAGLGDAALEALAVTAPLLLLLAAAGGAGTLAVGGWIFSTRACSFDFARLDPLRGAANLVSMRAATELVKSLAKAAVAAGIGALLLHAAWPELAAMAFFPAEAAAGRAAGLCIWAFAALAGGFAVIAAADVPLTLWRHARELRMTRDEARREQKELEGDPHLKARVRSLQRAAARRRMMAEVPKADVVVTNPTHYAVALSYRDGMRAPRVTAKGSGLVALRIRSLAAESGVPLLEAAPLARALHRHAELGAEIPGALYDAVAQVLAWVTQLRRARAAGSAEPAPPPPQAVTLPPEMQAVEAQA